MYLPYLNQMTGDIQKLRDVRIHTLLGIQYTGRRQTIRCPFHNDHEPSLVLYPDNSYHCFPCGAHGRNAIDFVMGINGGDFKDACAELRQYI